jgi:tetratricopeptide (TPR) repeat protein/uncharacterized protein Smg (DUF494 family)
MAKVSLRAYNREIEAMIDRGQLDEAIAHCQHILRTFPKHLETYRLLGKAYLEYKRFNDAVDIFSRVLAAEPNDFVSNVGLSIIRDEQNKMDDAIWHMERAFETQPSNPAIQSELQRLYSRRDGIQPPRIRMTRGALAHMYVQGELYPQAISEIKSVLKEDPGRSDMSVLLARAYYRSGQKNQAADEAAAVLRRYPYCLDANRVLVEIAGADRPESVQMYRQRVIELDPYAAQVTGSIFQSSEVGDNAVGLEHLEWNGQPVPMQSDWGTTKAIAPESGFGRDIQEPPQAAQAEPDWLKMGLGDSSPAPQAQPTVVPPLPESSSSFDFGTPSEPVQPTPQEEIPEFLRAAGWGTSTGEFDESKSMFGDEPETSSSPSAPLEQGDLPDWVKAMAPPPTAEPAQPTEEEALPDWIKNIGTGALASAVPKSSDDQPDWMKGPEDEEPESSTSVPVSSEQPDWMKGFDEPAQPLSSDEQPDWMKGIDQQSTTSESVASDDSMDWLKGLDQPETAQPTPSEEPDWLGSLNQPESVQPTVSDEQPDWMKGFEQQPATSESAASDDAMDWLKGLDQPEVSSQQSAADTTAMWLKGLDANEPAQPTAAVSDDQSDRMKSFDEPTVQQPAQSEELDWLSDIGTEPEAVPESTASIEQPDWLTQFGSQPEESTTTASVENEFDFLDDLSEKPATEPSMPAASAVDAGSLGKTEQERDDSFAWLEALAAKQGASEGLLTKPEERLQDEPDWVKQAKGMTQPPTPVEQPSVQPAANQEDLGKSQQEIDDSLAWLENLAAKQGATEGLLTKPEDRLEQEPEWVKQAKSAPQPSVAQPTAKAEELGKSQQEIDDSLAWLENLAAKQGATEGLLTRPEERLQEEPDWVKQAKSTPPSTPSAVQQPPTEPAPVEDLGKSDQERDDSFAWLEALAAKQGASEGLLTKPEERLEEEPEWVKQAKSAPPEAVSIPSAPTANVEDLGKSEQERDDSFAWLENLAAKQGATEGLLTKPEDRLEQEPEWVQQAKSAPQQPVEPELIIEEPISSADDTTAWLRSLEQEEVEPEPESSKDETAMWFKKLEETVERAPAPEPEAADDIPSWLKGLEEESVPESTPASDSTMMWLRGLDEPPLTTPQETQAQDEPTWLKGIEEEEMAPVVEAAVPETSPEAGGEFDWLNEIEEESAASPTPAAEEESLPAWLRGVDEETRLPETGSLRNLSGWMRDETGEVMAEPTTIEPTRATDWQPVEEKQPEPTPEPIVPEVEPATPEPQSAPAAVQPIEEQPKPKPAPRKPKPAEPKPEPYKEPVTTRGAGMLTMPVDPMLGLARNELSRSNIPGALQAYEKLIKKGRFLDEVIFDLREALYRYPVEISIWQALGDAYMRANRLQDALDAYTKAEELLR